jgi:hypothetical protein
MNPTPTEREQSRGLLAADLETTADLQPTADLEDEKPAALIRERPRAPMPKRNALGFIAFVTCAVVAIVFTPAQQSQSPEPNAQLKLTAAADAVWTKPAEMQLPSAEIHLLDMNTPVALPTIQAAASGGDQVAKRAASGVVAFDSRSFITSEKAVAAVFILKRTQFFRGEVLVRWAARSGTADAGIDFSDASGTVRFADGQRELAIYVPLRNDLLHEEDETFRVCLRSAVYARIGETSCAEAIIRDDDDAWPT